MISSSKGVYRIVSVHLNLVKLSGLVIHWNVIACLCCQWRRRRPAISCKSRVVCESWYVDVSLLYTKHRASTLLSYKLITSQVTSLRRSHGLWASSCLSCTKS